MNEREAGIAMGIAGIVIATLCGMLAIPTLAQADIRATGACARTLSANIVAFDMPLMWNRQGAQNINANMYALKRDVINMDSRKPLTEGGVAEPGRVALRPDKRPRPLVLRTGKGDCLKITLTNLLTPLANPFNANVKRSDIEFRLHINNAVAERKIGLRCTGTEFVGSEKRPIDADTSNVGKNGSSLIGPGDTTSFTIFTPYDGAFACESMGATTGGEGEGGQVSNGLWAVLNVEPQAAAFYRSQLTREEMELVTAKSLDPSSYDCGKTNLAADGKHPIVNYEAVYPKTLCDGSDSPWVAEGKAGKPIVNMVNEAELVHSDINAIIAYGPEFKMVRGVDGPSQDKLGHFPKNTYPLEGAGYRNPTVPNRLEPFREFTVAFHDEVATSNAYPGWFEDDVWSHTTHAVRDAFMINYSSGGIGSEIISNRIRVGPMHDCGHCMFEEFFLSAWTVGDVGELVDIPANHGLENCKPDLSGCDANGPKANYALFPDDPASVHHSYQGDSTAFRNVHVGNGEHHIFHLHNHQWLFNADDDNASYLDAQGTGPGSGFAYWINFGGSGNRNKSAGDAIFHCHFYPHFAQGMWEMWRVHDTFEMGTQLAITGEMGTHNGATTQRKSFVEDGLGLGNGTPAHGARALPDGEIVAGKPIPFVVPLPAKPMAPMPAAGVTVKPNPNEVCVGPSPVFGLKAKNADGTCPYGTASRSVGSLAEVPRVDKDGNDVTDITKMANPGYPFWEAGMEDTVGQRPSTAPLDMMDSVRAVALRKAEPASPLWKHPGFADAASNHGWDGGLPRFTLGGYASGTESIGAITRFDFSKTVEVAKPFFYPEEGTDLEQAVMFHHATRCHDSVTPEGTPAPCVGTDDTGDGRPDHGGFLTNGALPVAGAPYFEPCIDDRGTLLKDNVRGRFFGSSLVAMNDPSGMTTEGSSPYSAEHPRVYKAANVQFDAVFNKLGYHYAQERIIALWQDVVPTIEKIKAPEPLVMRMNTFDCTTYVHSNVVPSHFELDDYQVRTPTDVIGQHIHLPKWDLVASDGAANGWNYEDGTLSPEAVVELIHAINRWQSKAYDHDFGPGVNPVVTYAGTTKPVKTSLDYADGTSGLSATNYLLKDDVDHPFFGTTPYKLNWKGARSTHQRMFVDPVVNVQGVDRGHGVTFTHDHFGASTHQQIGLYATILTEPAGSKWVHNETGTPLHTRVGIQPADDGGPTSWQAAILPNQDSRYTGNVKWQTMDPYREAFLMFSDFQHAYQPDVYVGVNANQTPKTKYEFTKGDELGPGSYLNASAIREGQPDGETFRDAIQPSYRLQAALVNGFPKDIWVFPNTCPGGVARPCPEMIAGDDPGMYVVNYLNESLVARVFDPNRPDCPGGKPGCQAVGKQGDFAFALLSNVQRAIPELNDKLGKAPAAYAGGGGPVFNPGINNLSAKAGGDPFTPLFRSYDGDKVYVKVQAGGQEEEHTTMIHGLHWMQGGSGFGVAKNSGWRSAQATALSEQFNFRMPIFADINQRGNQADYAYTVSSSIDGWATGTWGILRSYSSTEKTLFALPSHDPSKRINVTNSADFNRVCPKTAPVRNYEITAVLAEDVLPLPKDGKGNSLVTIQDLYPGAHMGRGPAHDGGTLVFNSRTTSVVDSHGEFATHKGPLHDPAAILYVNMDDLEAKDLRSPDKGGDARCWTAGKAGKWKYDPTRPTCPLRLKPGKPVEPVVIRAAAGDCINVTLRNRLLTQAVTNDENRYPIYQDDGQIAYLDLGKGLNADTNMDGFGDTVVTSAQVKFDEMPEMAVGNPWPAMVRLRAHEEIPADPAEGTPAGSGMTSVQTNLFQSSPYVGLHPALVEYDVTRSNGTAIGQNNTFDIAAPGGQVFYQWYAGNLKAIETPGRRGTDVQIVATPIELGGFNLQPADVVKQPQHSMAGGGVIYPEGATWTVDAGTNTSATVHINNNELMFRDFMVIAQKGVAMFYSDSHPTHNLHGEGSFAVAEDSQDMGGMTINYGTEPLWFRFGVNPAGHDVLSNVNAELAYSNELVNGDPQTAVFTVKQGTPVRLHVLMPTGAGRGSTFDLHGHVWQRDPYVCDPGATGGDLNIGGKCAMGDGQAYNGEVGSKRLAGLGASGQWRFENPMGMGIGGQQSWFPGDHYEVVLPSAGGANSTKAVGDHLFRDHMGLGNAQGLWGLLRVTE